MTMINTLHLLWIIPLALLTGGTSGFVFTALIVAAGRSDTNV